MVKLTFVVILIHLLALIPLFHFVKPIKPKPTQIKIRTVEIEKPPSQHVVDLIEPPIPEKEFEAPPPIALKEPEVLTPVIQEKTETPEPVVQEKIKIPEPIVQENVEIDEPLVEKEPEKPNLEPIVQTETEKPKPIVKKEPVKPTPIVHKEPVKPKPIVKNEPEKTKPATQKKPIVKTNPVQKDRSELLALMEQSLVGLEKTSGKTSKVTAPSKVGKLKSESIAEISYQEKLVDYLQGLLHLPEDGSVGVKLTITREGKITNIVVLKTSSARNERYICDHLKSITLPPFGNNFKGESVHSFSLKLTSN